MMKFPPGSRRSATRYAVPVFNPVGADCPTSSGQMAAKGQLTSGTESTPVVNHSSQVCTTVLSSANAIADKSAAPVSSPKS